MDTKEYEEIVRKNIDTVYRIAISHTKNSTDADDVVQQTFVKMLARNVKITDEEYIKRWLIRVCINECNNLFSSFWRKNVNLFGNSEEEPNVLEKSIDPLFTREDSDLYEAIKMLPSKCKIVIYLFYYEGYSTKEIADIIHVKEATVRTRLVRGRKLLKKELAEVWKNE